MDWIILIIAGLFEMGFTTCLKMASQPGENKLLWNSAFLVCAIASFIGLGKAIQTIPLGTAYAVWTGIGAFGTILVGIIVFNEPVTPSRILFLSLLIASVLGLKFFS